MVRKSCSPFWPGMRPHDWVVKQLMALPSQCGARLFQKLTFVSVSGHQDRILQAAMLGT